ncbi:MAG: alanine--tRNA ligase, partial [Coriobacteriales bacterium]|nr:alanine--tRNA ligase [Coriobacteriales bacterium]
MKSSELREKYLSFFESKGCKRMPSSSLIPDDPSMLLTSAGMVQFKPYFLQQKQFDPAFAGTTTVQKCVRTTDIDIIGTTRRHQSFFEMLGNFSFGTYFKEEMCAWAYEFSTEVLGFAPERLYFTVYVDDDETIEIWKALGVPEDHITRLGDADNFWMAGPTGPCGPCSELYYDQGPELGCGSPDCGPGCDCDRYLEYWNCVFTQYDRQEDGSLVLLPKKNIDTGMGLERTAAILQGVSSNYETDILRGLIAVGEDLSHKSYGAFERDDLSLRICADHARAVTFMIADGILPSNEGRGYVLRRLLRRAVRHGQLLGIEPPFLGSYVSAIIDEMGGPYPELRENQRLVERIVHAEEERFGQTLRSGQSYLDTHLKALLTDEPAGVVAGVAAAGGSPDGSADGSAGGSADGSAAEQDKPTLCGKTVFELHDRYGFPIDLTIEIAAEQGVEVDREAFDVRMNDQRERARAAVKDDAWGAIGGVFSDLLSETGATRFVGYRHTQQDARVLAIVLAKQNKGEGVGAGEGPASNAGEGKGGSAGVSDGEISYVRVDSISDGERAQIVLDVTPFYGEMGGQVGDTGSLQSATATFTVDDTKVYEKAIYAHLGSVDGTLRVGDTVHAAIDTLRRERVERNHTATHLLHHALREVLGEHVKQAGSLVAPDRLRFDFTHFEGVTPTQIAAVEQLVNNLIMEDSSVSSYETSLDEARESGVTALFGEKYGETVRVLQAGPASRELCGGTHVNHTAQIGFLKIISESSVGANLRRVEAVTSFDALEYVNRIQAEFTKAAELIKAQPAELTERIEALQRRVQELEGELKQRRLASAVDDIDSFVEAAINVGYRLVIARSDGHVVEGLRSIWDVVRTKLGDEAAVVLGGLTPTGAPLLLAAGAPAAIDAGFDAGAIIKRIAPLIKGGGGGKPTMAQAGGKDAEGIDAALEHAR